MNKQAPKIAVAFLARGADPDWRISFKRFIHSYRGHNAGIRHALYVLYKGFSGKRDLGVATRLFRQVSHVPMHLPDVGFDIGAYRTWANEVDHDVICVLNTHSEILSDAWLLKLAANLQVPNVGLVGATGSFESLNELNRLFPAFPNPHVRSTAFMMERALFCQLTKGLVLSQKIHAWAFESGRNSLTRRVAAMDLGLRVVGRNGRGYSPPWWPTSDTYRQGTQPNLLVGDNQTRYFAGLPWQERATVVFRTWGNYLHEDEPQVRMHRSIIA